MNEFKQHIVDMLNGYKHNPDNDECTLIPIIKKSITIGHLKALNINYKRDNPEVVSLLSDWRESNPIGFASVFKISDDRTMSWIDNILLKREDRILFIIYSTTGRPLGHIGLSSFNYKEFSCEIDNVVRGVVDESRGIMTDALKTLIKWSKDKLLIQNVYLKVLSDNSHAIDFYAKNGFLKQQDIPLYKETLEDEVRWVEEKKGENQAPDRFYSYMKLVENGV